MDLQRAKVGHVRVYDSKNFVYVVGKCLLTVAGREFAASLEGRDELPARENAERYRLLRFEKARSMLPEARKFKDFVYEDPGLYTEAELQSVLERLAESKGRRTGGLTRIVDAVAIAGVVRFVKGFYLVLISNRVEMGQLDEHVIYTAQGSHMVPLFDEAAVDASAGTPARKSAWSIFSGTQDPLTAMEEEFKSLFKLVDLSKSFYWSYTYNLSMSVQRNVASRIAARARERDPSAVPPGAAKAIAEDNMFIWNEYLARPLLEALQTSSRSVFLSPWTVALVHGSFKQQRCSIISRSLTLTLVARRSRVYAGTRYLKRGVNDDGYVANDVEIEQIVQDHMLLANDPGGISAYVQMRGSIPTFWSQDSSMAMPKPPIKRQRFDPWYNATRRHFMDLIRRYGDAILVLNLVKLTEKRKRETIVGCDFGRAIEVLNSTLPASKAIEYWAVDFTRLSKVNPSSLLRALDTVARQGVRETSFFMTPAKALRFTEVNGNAPHWLASVSRDLRADLRAPEIFPFGCAVKRGPGFELGAALRQVPLRWSGRKSCFIKVEFNSALKLRTGDRARPVRESSRASRVSRQASLAYVTQDDDLENDDDDDASVKDASSVVATKNAGEDDIDDDAGENGYTPRSSVGKAGDEDGDDGDAGDDINQAGAGDGNPRERFAASKSKREGDQEEEELFTLGFGSKRRQSLAQDAAPGASTSNFDSAEQDDEVDFIDSSPNPSSGAVGFSNEHGESPAPEARTPHKHGSELADDEEYDDEEEEGQLRFTDLMDAQSAPSDTSPARPARPSAQTGGAGKRCADRIQHGVIRTNCIDCLDRTNLAQFFIGLHVVNEQLIALGILSAGERITTDTPIAAVLMEMYEELGDRIALQYGGSDAHRKSGKLVSSGSTSTRQQAFYTSLKRYYSNAFTDHAKQDAINVFLGLYRPEHHKRQRENADGTGDFYLHNRGVTYQPNFSLRPRVLDLGQWWSKPLGSFAERIVVPLRSLAEHPYEMLAPASSGVTQDDRGQGDDLTSFDALFSKPYFRPRELVDPRYEEGPAHDSTQLASAQHHQHQKQLLQSPQSPQSSPQPGTRADRSSSGLDFYNARMSTRMSERGANRLRHAGESNETVNSTASSATRASVSPDMRARLFGPRSAMQVLRGSGDAALEDVDEDGDNASNDSSISLTPSMSAAEALLDPSLGILVDGIDAVSQAYVQQADDPFSLYEHPSAACMWRSELARSSAQQMQPWISSPNDPFSESWSRRAHEREYRDALSEQQIHENDGWGMRRLQAYSGSTSVMMSGVYKGYPRSVTAAVLELA